MPIYKFNIESNFNQAYAEEEIEIEAEDLEQALLKANDYADEVSIVLQEQIYSWAHFIESNEEE